MGYPCLNNRLKSAGSGLRCRYWLSRREGWRYRHAGGQGGRGRGTGAGITSILFGHRAGELGLEGSELTVARQIREDYDPATVTIPYHPGSHAYYLREQPPFFVEYAEALSLGLTLLLALYSVFIAVREWLRRRMKNRVDAYLLQAEGIVEGTRNLGPVELRARYDALEAVRRAAFDDLIAERLYADEAFVILQNYLRDELASIESRLSRELASGCTQASSSSL